MKKKFFLQDYIQNIIKDTGNGYFKISCGENVIKFFPVIAGNVKDEEIVIKGMTNNLISVYIKKENSYFIVDKDMNIVHEIKDRNLGTILDLDNIHFFKDVDSGYLITPFGKELIKRYPFKDDKYFLNFNNFTILYEDPNISNNRIDIYHPKLGFIPISENLKKDLHQDFFIKTEDNFFKDILVLDYEGFWKNNRVEYDVRTKDICIKSKIDDNNMLMIKYNLNNIDDYRIDTLKASSVPSIKSKKELMFYLDFYEADFIILNNDKLSIYNKDMPKEINIYIDDKYEFEDSDTLVENEVNVDNLKSYLKDSRFLKNLVTIFKDRVEIYKPDREKTYTFNNINIDSRYDFCKEDYYNHNVISFSSVHNIIYKSNFKSKISFIPYKNIILPLIQKDMMVNNHYNNILAISKKGDYAFTLVNNDIVVYRVNKDTLSYEELLKFPYINLTYINPNKYLNELYCYIDNDRACIGYKEKKSIYSINEIFITIDLNQGKIIENDEKTINKVYPVGYYKVIETLNNEYYILNKDNKIHNKEVISLLENNIKISRIKNIKNIQNIPEISIQ